MMITDRLPIAAANGMLREQIAQLRRHITQCDAARGVWFSAALVGETLHQLIAPRFVTTVALACMALALACGWA